MQQFEVWEKFIVLEGLDGAGTSTQLQLLDKKLQEQQVPHVCTYEPTNGFIGQQIRKILHKDISAQPETLAMLFAADRYEHLYAPNHGIFAELAQGKVVVCDRYLFSSLAYQSLQCDFEWVYDLNAIFPLPGHLFFIDTPLNLCRERLERRQHEELFDAQTVQEQVFYTYKRIITLFEQTALQIHLIDGNRPASEIFQQIWTILASLPIIKDI